MSGEITYPYYVPVEPDEETICGSLHCRSMATWQKHLSKLIVRNVCNDHLAEQRGEDIAQAAIPENVKRLEAVMAWLLSAGTRSSALQKAYNTNPEIVDTTYHMNAEIGKSLNEVQLMLRELRQTAPFGKVALLETEIESEHLRSEIDLVRGDTVVHLYQVFVGKGVNKTDRIEAMFLPNGSRLALSWMFDGKCLITWTDAGDADEGIQAILCQHPLYSPFK